MLRIVFCILLLAGLAISHPQCLNYNPPFTPSGDFQLCLDYKDFGCCGSDNEINAKYNQQMETISTRNKQLCGPFIRDILCQVCSPFAAHLYNAETSNNPNAFPSLCPVYLIRFLSFCSESILNLSVPLPLPSPDQEFCFPSILNKTNTQNLGTVKISEEGNCMQLCVKEVTNDIYTPTAAVHANDGTHRLFVAEQRGVIWVFLPDFTRLEPAFLDIQNVIYSSKRAYDERGLLDLVFHPNYRFNDRFYVLYSAKFKGKHVSRVSEFKVSRDMNKALRSTERVVINIEQPATNHNGGKLLFKDGLLYIFTGDGGRAGDPFGYAQNMNSLLGKALRVDVDNRPADQAYGIPTDNPFLFTPGTKPEIFAYGLRNPWRCSMDRGDRVTGQGAGRIFCGDVGQDKYEEIDIIKSGKNYGWNDFEGNACFGSRPCSAIRNHEAPIAVYGHGEGKSITGGYVYRGCDSPNLNGLYIFADWWNGKLFYLKEDNGSWTRGRICIGDENICVNGGLSGRHVRYITSFAEDERGELYILATNYAEEGNFGGRIYKLVDPSRGGNPAECGAPQVVSGATLGPGTQTHPYAPITETSLSYRLAGAIQRNSGRVEIRRGNGPWGTICDDLWGRKEATVVCRALGFRIAVSAKGRAAYGRGHGPIHLDNLRCTGKERSLLECPNRGWGKHDCSHSEDASVVCF